MVIVDSAREKKQAGFRITKISEIFSAGFVTLVPMRRYFPDKNVSLIIVIFQNENRAIISLPYNYTITLPSNRSPWDLW